ALKYFYPRMSPGGVIIVHDYNHIWEGVRQAIHAFAPDIPEALVEVPDRQGSVMILRQKNPDMPA
ncbi:MAG: TylF/MycF/NovP-related O-methyltransferase, partial [Candidatus Sericytochromatia bacterium]